LRHSPMAHARFVALTGFGTSETRKRLEEAGFDQHFVKPISPDALIELLSTTPRIGRMEARLQSTPQ
jgi:CheY-like chemotaxis protein